MDKQKISFKNVSLEYMLDSLVKSIIENKDVIKIIIISEAITLFIILLYDIFSPKYINTLLSFKPL